MPERYRIIDPLDNESIFTYYSEFENTWKGQTEVEIVVLVIIFLFAVTSNILVLIVIYRKGKTVKVTDVFVFNISVSDILFAANIPIMITARVSPQWLLGTTGCKFLQFTQCITGATSILMMMLISLDRYIVICRVPCTRFWSSRLTIRHCVAIIVSTWLVASATCVPIALGTTERRIFFDQRWYVFCAITWPRGFNAGAYLGAMVTILFIVPLLVTALLYAKIFYFVRHTSRRMRKTRSISSSTKIQEMVKFHRPEIRLVKMFVAIVIVFFVTWLPFFIALFLVLHTSLMTSSQFLTCVIFTQITACIDPILYGYFNESYRQGLRTILGCSRNVVGVESFESNNRQQRSTASSKPVEFFTDNAVEDSSTV